MANSAAITSAIRPAAVPTASMAVPWYCLAVALGAACIPIGALWDISWHSTIGRDTFWNPAHIVIYLGGLIPGLSCGWLVFKTTYFATAEEQASSVRFWGFRGPLGAWVVIWGALAMLTSAPFDDWWHNAYGLDVEILSPPHTVLAAGMYAVALGSLLLVLSWQNKTAEAHRKFSSMLFIITAGVLLTMSTIIVTEKIYPNQQHGGSFYRISCAIYPLYLIIAARASRIRWAATGAAAVYMAIMLAMLWILPLFPATPKLAPIYKPVDHMVPPNFPLLLIIPAIAIDLLVQRFGQARSWWKDWLLAVALGIAFLALLLAVQWPFSKFLLSPAASNWFFASDRHWPYFIRPGEWQYRFWNIERDRLSTNGLAVALLLGTAKFRIGLWIGNWMSKVRR